MNHYFNITLLPDAEMPATVLMNAICAKVHKQLYDMQSKTIGISFPKYDVTLGNILRIHSNDADLQKLHGASWLGGMNGYCKISAIFLVPEKVQYRIISRIQPTMSPTKLQRLLKRGTITDDKVKGYKAKMFDKEWNKPYVELVSASNGHNHRRYIKLGELLDKPVAGIFDQFGLSKTATVPWF